MTGTVPGTVAPGYGAVSDAFSAGFAGRPEMGAAISIWKDGENVVNLWGGVADARSARPWSRATPNVVFSCTKGLVSLVIARLVEDGRISYDEPVSKHWPEFGNAGKQDVTVAQLLAHRAGLSAPATPFSRSDILDWEKVTRALAAQEPLWEPGSAYAYHALTHGWLAGELVRQVTGQSVGSYFANLVAKPLAVDAWIGLPGNRATDVAHLRVNPLLSQLWADEAANDSDERPNWAFRAMTLGHALPADLVTEADGFNAPDILAAEIPGAGGVATADALATIWSATVVPTKGIRLINDSTLDQALVVQSEGAPIFGTGGPFPRWGMGFQLDSEARRYLSDASFGHDGAGGQVSFADSRHRLGFAYVTNWMMGPEDDRATRIIDALRTCL